MTKLRVLSLFAGIGGFDLGLERTGGFETVAFCEIDPFNNRILNDNWPAVPRYDDVRELTGKKLHDAGIYPNVIVGGFPCQDASVANIGGEGALGDRTGLYSEMCRLAWQLGVDFMLMENVANLLNRGFGDVLGALAEIGFDAEWECISARDVGANHERERIWIMAYPQCAGRQGPQPLHGVLGRAKASLAKHGDPSLGGWRSLVSHKLGIRAEHGLSVGMERRRLFALGNAVVPQIPELIGRAILASLREERAAA